MSTSSVQAQSEAAAYAHQNSAPSPNAVASTEPPPQAATPVAKDFSHISNADFIAVAIGTLPANTYAAVCSKKGDPTTGNWFAMTARAVNVQTPNDRNNYVNCASFQANEKGEVQANKASFTSLHFLLLDDLGGKVPWAKLEGFLPSFVIETSPGNYQAGIILAQPITDPTQATRLIQAIIAKGLSDPGATGVVRWARLPHGINGKEKYKSETGGAFSCRLVRWNPERRYTVDEIVTGLKLVMDASSASLHSDMGMSGGAALHEVKPEDVAKLPALLAAIDPDCSRDLWIKAMMGVHHTTAGSADGFRLFDAWSSKGKKYKGVQDIEAQWKSLHGHKGPYITIGTLIKMAAASGADIGVITQTDDGFKKCTDEDPSLSTVSCVPVAGSEVLTSAQYLLGRYSASRDLLLLERNMVEQKPLLGHIALMGQASTFYAKPNTGKTLIIIRLLLDAIKTGRVDPSKVFYINMDDNSSGLLTKCRLAQEYGFHMLADGHQGFQAKDFRVAMLAMIEAGTAKGVVVILDTLKKFVNTMSKENSSNFAAVVRQFCMKGGTVIALAHTNKNPGSDGKPVYSGTTDIVDDFDCAYTLAPVAGDSDQGQKLVEFENIKRRGDVALTAAYSYASHTQGSYEELVLSVQEVDLSQLAPIKQAAELQSDAAVIDALAACIQEGINTKMKMVEAVSKSIGVSNRNVLKVLEKYTGTDVRQHRWNFAVGARGAQIFALLHVPMESATDSPPGAPVDAPIALAPTAPAESPSAAF